MSKLYEIGEVNWQLHAGKARVGKVWKKAVIEIHVGYGELRDGTWQAVAGLEMKSCETEQEARDWCEAKHKEKLAESLKEWTGDLANA